MKLDLEQDVKGLLPEKDFDRRDFIWTALGASAALALASPASAQQVVTDANGLDAADVMIPVKDGQLRGYRAMPATGGPFPVVLVAAEIFGLNPYIKDVCRRLAKAGYYAIVPDLYTRKADLTKITVMAEIMPIVNTKYDTELVTDYDATVAFAQASGKADVATGVGFYDHLLTSLAHHSLLDIEVKATGDLEIDEHHTVEDVALVLGAALAAALGDRAGIRRFGDASVPMDEAVATAVIDVGGRPYAVLDLPFRSERIGGLPTQQGVAQRAAHDVPGVTGRVQAVEEVDHRRRHEPAEACVVVDQRGHWGG